MTDFEDLCKLRTAPILWVLILTGTDRFGDPLTLYTSDHDFVADVDGAVRPVQGIWAAGQAIGVKEAIARAEVGSGPGATPDRSFLATESTLANAGTLRLVPDQKTKETLTGADLRGGRFDLYGWGETKADGTAFPWAQADLLIQGLIERVTLPGNGTLEVGWKREIGDFDQPYQKDIFRGMGGSMRIITAATADNPQIGQWLPGNGTPHVVTGDICLEIFGISRNAVNASITEASLWRLGSNKADTNWAIYVTANGGISFGSDAERIAATSGFALVDGERFHIAANVAADGKTVTLYGSLGRDPDALEQIGSGVLTAAISEPSFPNDKATHIGPRGEPFGIGQTPTAFEDIGGPAFVIDFAEMRRWTARTFAQLQETAHRTIRADELADHPGLLGLLRGNSTVNPAFMVDEGNDSQSNMVWTRVPQFNPFTGVFSALDGPLPDLFANDAVGRTVPIAIGGTEANPIVNVTGHLVDVQRDGFALADKLTDVMEVRSRQAPITLDESISASFDVDVSEKQITINAAEPATVTFRRFVRPDGGLPGQVIEASGFTSIDGELTIASVADDERSLVVEEVLAGGDETISAIVRTPLTGVSKFQLEVDLAAGGVVLDRATIVDAGQITADVIGELGPGGTADMSDAFELAVETFIGTGVTVNRLAGLFDPEIGLYLPIGGAATFREIAWRITGAGFGWWAEERDGSYTLGTYAVPAGSPVGEMSPATGLKSVRELSRVRPFWRFETLHAKNHTEQDPDAAADAVPQLNRQQWQEAGSVVLYVDAVFKASDPTSVARKEPIETLILSKEDAEAYRDVAAPVLAADLTFYRIEDAGLGGAEFHAGDEVTVSWDDPLLGLAQGRNMILISRDFSTGGTVTWEAYGRRATLIDFGEGTIDFGGGEIEF